jgi:hypothetical protein
MAASDKHLAGQRRYRDELADGKRYGPRLFWTARPIDRRSPETPAPFGVRTAEEARAAVRHVRSLGASHVKVFPGGEGVTERFHRNAIEWRRDRIDFFVDGFRYLTVTPASLPAGSQWVFSDNRFYAILNVAVGGVRLRYPDRNTSVPQRMVVDYVRFLQRQSTPRLKGSLLLGLNIIYILVVNVQTGAASVDLVAAKSFVQALIGEYGLQGWRVGLDIAVRRFGCCHHPRKAISLSRRLVN